MYGVLHGTVSTFFELGVTIFGGCKNFLLKHIHSIVAIIIIILFFNILIGLTGVFVVNIGQVNAPCAFMNL